MDQNQVAFILKGKATIHFGNISDISDFVNSQEVKTFKWLGEHNCWAIKVKE